MIIKDCIRQDSTASDIVTFLSESSISLRSIDLLLSSQCLLTLSQFIGWFDISLIINTPVLPNLYSSLSHAALFSSACSCLLELAKKGMDSISKIKMLQSTSLTSVICSVPLPLLETISNTPTTDDESDNEGDPAADLGSVLNAVYLELLECWGTYEGTVGVSDVDNTYASNDTSAINADLTYAAYVAADMARACTPRLLSLFAQGSLAASSSVSPALTRLIALLKAQSKRINLDSFKKSCPPGYFCALDYLRQILEAIFQQMQYSDDFEFDADDDEDIEVMEVS